MRIKHPTDRSCLHRFIPSRCLAVRLLLAGCLLVSGIACTPSSFLARQIRVAPNQRPKWLTEPGRWMPAARVTLTYYTPDPARLVRGEWASVGQPPVPFRLGIIEPGEFGFHPSGRWETNSGSPVFRFEMQVRATARQQRAASSPRGTVFLLHGYGLSQDVLIPWGIALAESGWRCVLIDLRGHGASGGRRLGFGVLETEDLRLILDEMERRHAISGPVGVLGDSYGAAIALRWASHDARIRAVVAMAPYDSLAQAMEGLRGIYARWIPARWVRGAAEELPRLMGVPPENLNTGTALGSLRAPTLFIAGEADPVAPVETIRTLASRWGSTATVQILSRSGHEEVPYDFDQLQPPITAWLDRYLR